VFKSDKLTFALLSFAPMYVWPCAHGFVFDHLVAFDRRSSFRRVYGVVVCNVAHFRPIHTDTSYVFPSLKTFQMVPPSSHLSMTFHREGANKNGDTHPLLSSSSPAIPQYNLYYHISQSLSLRSNAVPNILTQPTSTPSMTDQLPPPVFVKRSKVSGQRSLGERNVRCGSVYP